MPFANLGGFRFFYETRGVGEPLILIPGFASGAWIWFEQVSELSKYFSVITFDPRGIASSSVGENQAANVAIKTFAEDVAQLLDYLKIEKTHVLGASFGGFVALEFALLFPEKLDKLILACTSFGGENHVAPHFEILSAFASAAGQNESEQIRKFMVPAFTPEFVVENESSVEKVCQLREQNIVPESVNFGQLRAATTYDVEAQMSEIKNKTLVLTGDADAVVPPQNSRNLADAIANAKLKVFKGGSHMFFIEKASEFNRMVTEFLQSN